MLRRPRMARVRRLGEVIGSFLLTLTDKCVLVIGSGGLSHDPPVPRWATADEPQRALLLNGRHPTAAARNARQQRVLETARALAAGIATIRDLNPQWDQEIMRVLASGDLSPIDVMTRQQMATEAGNSAHEVRTWVAAFAALASAGPYVVTSSYYRPIREYIAGFGVMTARHQRLSGRVRCAGARAARYQRIPGGRRRGGVVTGGYPMQPPSPIGPGGRGSGVSDRSRRVRSCVGG